MKKLFRVEINHVAYVWTEDQDAADEFVDFIRFNEDPKVDIEIAKEIRVSTTLPTEPETNQSKTAYQK